MSKTKMQAGKLVAVYVDDPLGRRIVLGAPNDSGTVVSDPLVVGSTKAEVREVARVLRELAEELP